MIFSCPLWYQLLFLFSFPLLVTSLVLHNIYITYLLFLDLLTLHKVCQLTVRKDESLTHSPFPMVGSFVVLALLHTFIITLFISTLSLHLPTPPSPYFIFFQIHICFHIVRLSIIFLLIRENCLLHFLCRVI